MLKKSDLINVLSVGIKLFLITAISAVLLAVFNYVTEPIIEANNIKIQNDSMRIVLPLAKDFQKQDMSSLALVDLKCSVTSIYKGIDDEGNEIGYVVIVSSDGYGGDISLAVGVDNKFAVTGVDVMTHSETPGLGAKCNSDVFKNQFIGKTSNINVVKSGADGNEIDAITSATITSKAVTNAVNTAITAANMVKEAE